MTLLREWDPYSGHRPDGEPKEAEVAAEVVIVPEAPVQAVIPPAVVAASAPKPPPKRRAARRKRAIPSAADLKAAQAKLK